MPRTALMVASQSPACVTALLKGGAAVDAVTEDGCTALYLVNAGLGTDIMQWQWGASAAGHHAMPASAPMSREVLGRTGTLSPTVSSARGCCWKRAPRSRSAAWQSSRLPRWLKAPPGPRSSTSSEFKIT